jgi:glycerophosphoryl diester phosphodiesterase
MTHRLTVGSSDRPSVIAHRGASGEACENSAEAFRRAVALGADGVELDIHATRDETFVVYHDFALPGRGPIGQLPLSAVQKHRLANGEPVPTLAEVLQLLEGLDVWIEVKTLPAAADEALLAQLAAGPTPARYAVHAFDHRIIARLGDRQPDLRRGILLSSYLLDIPAAIRGAGADTLWMQTQLIDAALVTQTREQGFTLIAWTANETEEISRLASLGVDAICGNYPDRIRRVLATNG